MPRDICPPPARPREGRPRKGQRGRDVRLRAAHRVSGHFDQPSAPRVPCPLGGKQDSGAEAGLGLLVGVETQMLLKRIWSHSPGAAQLPHRGRVCGRTARCTAGTVLGEPAACAQQTPPPRGLSGQGGGVPGARAARLRLVDIKVQFPASSVFWVQPGLRSPWLCSAVVAWGRGVSFL